MNYSADVVGGVKLRLRLRYDTLIEMVFDLMEEIKNMDLEDFDICLKEKELKELNKQARYIDHLMNLEIKDKLKTDKNDKRK